MTSAFALHKIAATQSGRRREFHLLVGANSSRLKSLGAQLFVFVGDHVNAEGKFVDICALATEVEDPNLRVGYTTVESRLGIWLEKSVRFFGG